MDGIDGAVIYSDGEKIDRLGPALSHPYTPDFHNRLRAILQHVAGFEQRQPDDVVVAVVEQELTDRHAALVMELLQQAGLTAGEVDLIGFHGQTILHRPDLGFTWQLGDGARLAAQTGIAVVNDFRANDMAHGGEGAPFAPLYHAALMRQETLSGPVAVLNLGGVGNVTWIAADGREILSFDTGPANSLLDDWMQKQKGLSCDLNGEYAGRGGVDEEQLARLMDHPYFDRIPPKSLDRGDFSIQGLELLSVEDGAATLTAFTSASVRAALAHLPAPPLAWYVTGGGRHNPVLMDYLAKSLEVSVAPVEILGWRGDSLEAELFAYLAIRSRLGLPLSLPATTGAKQAVSGGCFYPSRLSR